MINVIITTLQQNAEWLCAIAIVYFAYKQCEIAKLQIRQDLRLKRLELAQKMDEVFKEFPSTKKEADDMLAWLFYNQSTFTFLLNKKDIEVYKELSTCMFNLCTQRKYEASTVDKMANLRVLFGKVTAVRTALGNADYYILKDIFPPEKGPTNDKTTK